LSPFGQNRQVGITPSPNAGAMDTRGFPREAYFQFNFATGTVRCIVQIDAMVGVLWPF